MAGCNRRNAPTFPSPSVAARTVERQSREHCLQSPAHQLVPQVSSLTRVVKKNELLCLPHPCIGFGPRSPPDPWPSEEAQLRPPPPRPKLRFCAKRYAPPTLSTRRRTGLPLRCRLGLVYAVSNWKTFSCSWPQARSLSARRGLPHRSGPPPAVKMRRDLWGGNVVASVLPRADCRVGFEFSQRQSAALASAVCVSLRIASALHPSDTGVRRDEGDSKQQDRLLTPVFGCRS
jgi:hypothetical protein